MATLETPKITLVCGRLPLLSAEAWQQVREYGPTFATEFTVLACQLLTFKLAAHFLGKQGFSEYAVARRVISTIYPVALLGFGVALPRYVAISAHEQQAGLCDRFFSAAVWCVGLVAVILLGVMNLAPSRFAYLIYGGGSYGPFVFPISLVIGGQTFHALCYAYFRGRLQMKPANLLQFLNLAAVPVLAFFVGDRSPKMVLERIGWLSVLVSVSALWWTPWRAIGSRCFAEAKTQLRYGVPRVPGDFAQMALLGLPTFFVAHIAGVQQAGYVAISISMVLLIGAIFTPVGLILLPKSSFLFARGSVAELREHVMFLLKMTFAISIALSAVVFFAPGVLVQVLLGPQYGEVAQIVRLIVPGAVPYSVFLVLRNVLDAFHEHAVTSAFLIMSLCIFCIGALIFQAKSNGVNPILFFLLAALVVLGLLTLLETFRVLSDPKSVQSLGRVSRT